MRCLWKAKIERECGTQTDFVLAASGEMVKLAEGYLYCGNTATLNKSLKARNSSTALRIGRNGALEGMDLAGL